MSTSPTADTDVIIFSTASRQPCGLARNTWAGGFHRSVSVSPDQGRKNSISGLYLEMMKEEWCLVSHMAETSWRQAKTSQCDAFLRGFHFVCCNLKPFCQIHRLVLVIAPASCFVRETDTVFQFMCCPLGQLRARYLFWAALISIIRTKFQSCVLHLWLFPQMKAFHNFYWQIKKYRSVSYLK